MIHGPALAGGRIKVLDDRVRFQESDGTTYELSPVELFAAARRFFGS